MVCRDRQTGGGKKIVQKQWVICSSLEEDVYANQPHILLFFCVQI